MFHITLCTDSSTLARHSTKLFPPSFPPYVTHWESSPHSAVLLWTPDHRLFHTDEGTTALLPQMTEEGPAMTSVCSKLLLLFCTDQKPCIVLLKVCATPCQMQPPHLWYPPLAEMHEEGENINKDMYLSNHRLFSLIRSGRSYRSHCTWTGRNLLSFCCQSMEYLCSACATWTSHGALLLLAQYLICTTHICTSVHIVWYICQLFSVFTVIYFSLTHQHFIAK